ncbi:MAG: hypothetical protein AB8B63_19955 [Granulosicoccus sp.]
MISSVDNGVVNGQIPQHTEQRAESDESRVKPGKLRARARVRFWVIGSTREVGKVHYPIDVVI